MKRLLIVAMCLWSVEVALGGPAPEKYEVRLLRAAKAGDTYRMQAACRQSQKMKLIRGGRDVKSQSTEFFLELESGVRILEVSRDGYATRFALSVTKFTKTQGEAKTTLIPSGSLVMGSVTDAGYGFEVSGSPLVQRHTSLCVRSFNSVRVADGQTTRFMSPSNFKRWAPVGR